VLRPGRFDVVNFHNVSLMGAPSMLHMAPDAARLYMAHAHWTVCPTHVLWRFKKELCTEKRCIRCQVVYRRPPQLWRYTKMLTRGLQAMDATIAMSAFSRDKHREFGFPCEMEVLPAFLPEAVPSTSAASPHARPYFLFAGRLERIKGVDELIACAKTYEDADILIAGSGSHAEALKTQASGNPRIHFVGHLSVDALQRYYEHALAVILPSVCFETFGLGLIEAFRAGTPVIARRLGPFPEIVDRAAAGLLFSTQAELRAAMQRMQAEPGLRARLSQAAHEAFLEHWTERSVLPAYMEIVGRARARAEARRGARGVRGAA
jgi:glycosyltransferase involved in cell wall biosynthesis